MSTTFVSGLAERFRGPEQRLSALGDATRAAAQTLQFMPESFA